MVMLSFFLAPALAAAATSDYRSTAAARAVVQRYYDAIEHGRYAQAYSLWGGDGAASGKSYRAFVRGFAATAHTRVIAGAPSLPDGGAGSIYVTVPVEVQATLKNGAQQRFAGRYVLRRVNDVDGSTMAQRHWHIDSARLIARRVR